MSAMNTTVRQMIQFLEPLEDDFKCPICHETLQEPHLTTCCGTHHLCKVCMENVKSANGRCPFCRKKPFTGFIDKRFERQLNELKVYCIYRPKGCEWVGKFGKIEQHLNIGKENGECQFVVVECPVSKECKEYFLRKNLENHVNNNCKYRQTQCMYCGFVSTYQNITTSHPKQCTKFPLCCPNKCSHQTYPRDQLGTHLASCPEQEVDCTFSEMGCKEKIKRRVLQEHLDTNLLQHQLIMCQVFTEMKKGKQEVEEQLEILKKEVDVKMKDTLRLSNQEDNQIKSLKQIVKTNSQFQSEYLSKMTEFSDVNPVVPIMLKASFKITVSRENDHNYNRPKYNNNLMINYQKAIYHYTAEPYQSQFFYSHLNGYRLQLSAEVICHCSNCRKPQQKAATAIQSHQSTYQYDELPAADLISVENDDATAYNPRTEMSFAINLYIFKGDRDSQLEWPFKEKVTVTMYQENDGYNRRDPACAPMRCGGNPNYCNKILHAVAIFEGNQNYKNTGSKLTIKSIAERDEANTSQLASEFRSWQESSQPMKVSQFFRKPVHVRVPIDKVEIGEKGLLLPLRGWNGNGTYNKTIYFEVTFSP